MRPCIAYADTECTLTPTNDRDKVSIHTPKSACFYFVCSYDETQNKLWVGYGKDCIYNMTIELNKLAEQRIAKMRENAEMIMQLNQQSDANIQELIILIVFENTT